MAQTGQVFDVWRRLGNVHDSNGAQAFILACIREIRAILPRSALEVRMDSAFFSDAIVGMLDTEGVEFTISVPFARFHELKGPVDRGGPHRLDSDWTKISVFLHYEQQALERNDEAKKTYPFT